MTYQEVKARLLWSESKDLEFKPDFKENDWQHDRIFDTIIAMANNEGGNIIIGIEESESKYQRRIIGTNHYVTRLGDKLHQLIREYVDPMDLSLDVYPIESKGRNNPKLIGLEVKNQPKRFYAKRYYGRSTSKPVTYALFLRINGQTITTDFMTFINFVYGKATTTDDVLITFQYFYSYSHHCHCHC